jgi:hypothetical protein
MANQTTRCIKSTNQKITRSRIEFSKLFKTIGELENQRLGDAQIDIQFSPEILASLKELE